nr:MAG TPA: hypothetical protein [Caudoviricetes sp.]
MLKHQKFCRNRLRISFQPTSRQLLTNIRILSSDCKYFAASVFHFP